MGHIRVLVVDDSAFMRQILSQILASDPEIEVVGTAKNGRQALEMSLELRPHVITLDVEMPQLDGFGTLLELMEQNPTPVVMVSTYTREGADATLRALALGAVDFVTKTSGAVSLDMGRVKDELLSKVKLAARATPRWRRGGGPSPGGVPGEKPAPAWNGPTPAERIVVIGTSTGGPGALHRVIPHLPADLAAGVLVVQHMPPGFTRSLAQHLAEVSAIQVREAAAGDEVLTGTVLVAPGGFHMVLDEQGRIRLNKEPAIHGVRPAVDKTLLAVAPRWGANCLGVILTGMGCDGTMGLAAVRSTGGSSLVEDASTCVVYGMPRSAINMGLADEVLPIGQIADSIVRFSSGSAPVAALSDLEEA